MATLPEARAAFPSAICIDGATGAIGWTWDGVTLTAPPEPPVTIPQEITPLQGLLALDAAGVSAAYEAWASGPARTFAERAFINKAQTWRRNDPVLAGAAIALGITEEQLDGLFVMAVGM